MSPEPTAEAPALVTATWRGPFVADMGPKQPDIHPGEQCLVTPEMAASDHWEVDPEEAAAAQAQAEANAAATKAKEEHDAAELAAAQAQAEANAANAAAQQTENAGRGSSR